MKMDDLEMQKKLNEYCSNEMNKLKQICYPLISKMGGISPMDHDDLYSIALKVLWDSLKRYDDLQECKFTTFFRSNIQKKFDTYIRDQNRGKRSNTKTDRTGNTLFIPDISIDAAVENGVDIFERIDSGFCIEDEISEEICFSLNDNTREYINSLPPTQKIIAKMIMAGDNPTEIKDSLNLTEKQYINHLKDMRAFEKTRILKHVDSIAIEEAVLMECQTQTLEKSKADRLSIASIIKKIDNYTIRFDHPLQRESEQWSPAMKGNLISDILQKNPIPPLVFAEQVVNGLAVIWDLDGKQRCTNVYSFINDVYKITKNIRRWNICYQARVKDEKGNQVLDESGFPKSEKHIFDIRGKKFSDLPEELKDRLLEYNFEIVQYLNCSSEDIAYHIARYNEGKPMSASQKGITRLGEEFASMVKSISAMPFFKEQGGYKVSESNNGTVNRVVVESVMAAKYLDDWKKKQEDMCEYMRDNAKSEDFDHFEDMVGRISAVGTEEVFNMFDSKDSFIWFGLFAKFMDLGVEDKKFIDFMAEISQSLHSKKVEAVSFDDLNEKSTKDKTVVISKIRHLETLMMEYLGLDIESYAIGEEGIFEFLKENIISDITLEDVEQYQEVLEELTLKVDNTSKLLDAKNKLSLVALVAYAFTNDIDLDEWIVSYFEKNNTYIREQNNNLHNMIADLEKYRAQARQ